MMDDDIEGGVAPLFLGPTAAPHASLFAALARWVEAGWLRELDRSFAAFLSRMAPQADPLVVLAGAWASHQLGRGHSCLDLGATCQDAGLSLSLPPEGHAGAADGAAQVPPDLPGAFLGALRLQDWQAALDAVPALVGQGAGNSPLVRDGHRLYLRRYWQYEQQVRAQVARRVATTTAAAQPAAQPLLAQALDALFEPAAGSGTPGAIDWQKAACALAARQAFSIVTGGPGTGKTTTVVRLLAVLQHLALTSGGRRLRIGLAAPTGKAAARLSESIAGAVRGLPLARLPGKDERAVEALRAAIPTNVSTVHRLLGSRPNTRRFRHDALNPLPLDLLVVDEASMLDLEMMACLLAALPDEAPLILLGDKDQLASVEAGAVLGDLCRRADGGHYTPDTARWLEAVTAQRVDAEFIDPHGQPLDQAIAKLRVSWRFGADSGIGRLSDAVNSGRPDRVADVLAHGYADLCALDLAGDDPALTRLVVDGACEGAAGHASDRPPRRGHGHYLNLMRQTRPPHEADPRAFDDWAAALLRALGSFQLLCALRRGPQGVEALNQRIARLLRAQGLLDAQQAGWYAGRPVMVTRNDYALDLRNGDVGLALTVPARRPGAAAAAAQSDEAPAWRLRVAFPAPDAPGGVRWVLPSRLREVETVFAMTVHKSQGSEFSHAALLLPEHGSPVVTRELLYTGITRARHWFTLAASPASIASATSRAVQRVGGLGALGMPGAGDAPSP